MSQYRGKNDTDGEAMSLDMMYKMFMRDHFSMAHQWRNDGFRARVFDTEPVQKVLQVKQADTTWADTS